MHQAPWDVRVLGPISVLRGTEHVPLSGECQLRLFVRLLASRGTPVAASQLRDDVWNLRDRCDSTLRVSVARLRRALGDSAEIGLIRRIPGGYVLDASLVRVDADEFESLVDGRAADERGPTRYETLRGALGRWRGDEPYAPLSDWAVIRAEVERLRSLREQALDRSLHAGLDVGFAEELIPDLEAAVAKEPLREGRTAALMLALYRTGRQADCLAAYRALERALRDQLGLRPTTPLRDLELRVLSHDPSLLLTA